MNASSFLKRFPMQYFNTIIIVFTLCNPNLFECVK